MTTARMTSSQGGTPKLSTEVLTVRAAPIPQQRDECRRRSLIGGGVTKYHTCLMADTRRPLCGDRLGGRRRGGRVVVKAGGTEPRRLRHRSVSRSLTPWKSARSAAGGRWAGSPWQRWAHWSPESSI